MDIARKQVYDPRHVVLAQVGSNVMNEISASGNWNDELEGKFKELVEKFKSTQTW